MKKSTSYRIFIVIAAVVVLCACIPLINTLYRRAKIADAPSAYSDDTDDLSSSNDESSAADKSDTESITDSETESKPDEKKSEMFDVSPISAAYRSGDTSALSEFELEIYDKACSVLDEIILDGMTDYEKELAVHDYLIYNCTYDKGELSAIPHPSENCDNPYGALINGQAICKGYTTTFRMFMGMLGIPCGTVHSCDIEGDEHAWNTVKLDGSWYYVDCTWDDPVPDRDGRPITHEYFNVSYDKISEDHVLPENAPQTDSIKYSYANQSACEITELSQIADAAKQAYDAKHDSFVLLFDESLGIELSDDEIGDYIYPIDEKYFKTAEKELKKLSCTISYAQIVETEQGTAVEIFYALGIYD